MRLFLILFTIFSQPTFAGLIPDFQPGNIEHFGLGSSNTLSLTFDDGPGEGTARILDLLKQNNIKATFFVIGTNGAKHPELLDRIVREGHVLANHSYTHPHLNAGVYAKHPELLLEELQKTHDVIRQYLLPNSHLYFRAPFGSWQAVNAQNLNKDPELVKYVGPIYWDIGGEIDRDKNGHFTDAADWDCWGKKLSIDQCIEGYLTKSETLGGGVVLSHDIYANTAAMWEKLLPILIQKGFHFETVDQISALDQFRRH